MTAAQTRQPVPASAPADGLLRGFVLVRMCRVLPPVLAAVGLRAAAPARMRKAGLVAAALPATSDATLGVRAAQNGFARMTKRVGSAGPGRADALLPAIEDNLRIAVALVAADKLADVPQAERFPQRIGAVAVADEALLAAPIAAEALAGHAGGAALARAKTVRAPALSLLSPPSPFWTCPSSLAPAPTNNPAYGVS